MKKSLWMLVVVLALSAFVLAAENINIYSDAYSDSSFSGYDPKVTCDGERNEGSEEGRWAEVAWASLETPDEHWLEYELAGKSKIQSIFIWWARDRGVFWYSEDIVIEVNGKVVYDSTRSKDKNPLVKEVKRKEGDALGYQVTEIYFNEPINGDTVRIIQLPGGGNPDRPNIMWVAEVEIFE